MDVVVKWECQLCSTENTKSYQCCCTWTARSRSSASWFVFLSVYLMNKTWLLLHVVASLDSVSSTGRIRARVTCRFSLPLPHFYWTEYKTRNKKGGGLGKRRMVPASIFMDGSFDVKKKWNMKSNYTAAPERPEHFQRTLHTQFFFFYLSICPSSSCLLKNVDLFAFQTLGSFPRISLFLAGDACCQIDSNSRQPKQHSIWSAIRFQSPFLWSWYHISLHFQNSRRLIYQLQAAELSCMMGNDNRLSFFLSTITRMGKEIFSTQCNDGGVTTCRRVTARNDEKRRR